MYHSHNGKIPNSVGLYILNFTEGKQALRLKRFDVSIYTLM